MKNLGKGITLVSEPEEKSITINVLNAAIKEAYADSLIREANYIAEHIRNKKPKSKLEKAMK